MSRGSRWRMLAAALCVCAGAEGDGEGTLEERLAGEWYWKLCIRTDRR